MSSNVYPNPGLIFPYSVFTGNDTWLGRSVQCCICSKWVYLKCSLLFFSKFPLLQTFYPPFTHFVTSPSAPSPPPHAPGCLSAPPVSYSSHDSLRIFQWNAGGLRARSTELLHLLLSHPVDLICIKKSNLDPSSSFWIPGFSPLRFDRTHSRSGILFPDATHARDGVIIIVRHGLSF